MSCDAEYTIHCSTTGGCSMLRCSRAAAFAYAARRRAAHPDLEWGVYAGWLLPDECEAATPIAEDAAAL